MGREWGNHKYIRKEGNRYIYPSDLKKISRDHADQMKEVRELRNMERREHLNRQGSGNGNFESAKKQAEFSRSMMQREKAAEERQRKRDGSWDKMHGQVAQEAAKKQGAYSRHMMKKEKRASQINRGNSYVKRMLSR